MSHSLYFARPSSKNAFPAYTIAELLRDLDNSSLDAETKAKIEAEIARRIACKRAGAKS